MKLLQLEKSPTWCPVANSDVLGLVSGGFPVESRDEEDTFKSRLFSLFSDSQSLLSREKAQSQGQRHSFLGTGD